MLLHDLRLKLVVLSDLHIKKNTEDRYLLLLKFLKELLDQASSIDTLVLLGDVFDFCFGYSKQFKESFSLLAASLRELSKKGTRVIFLEGNHEFAVKQLAWEGVEFTTQENMMLVLGDKSTMRLALCHGDLINAPWHYHIFRRIIKSFVAIQIARLLPDKFFNAFCHRLADSSRTMEKYRRINHTKLLDAAARWLNAQNCEIGIMGHFHVPYAESVALSGQSMKGLILCLPSWTFPNVLVIDHEFTIGRIVLEEAGYRYEHAESFLAKNIKEH